MESRSGNEGIPYSIRNDFKIDRDTRAAIFDTWLLNNGFIYISTLMSNPDKSISKIGGVRRYKSDKLSVGIFHQGANADLSYYIDDIYSHKELAHGVGIPFMILQIKKLSGE